MIEYWRILWRKRGVLIIFVLLGAALGTLVTVYEEPTYVARTSLEFQPRASANLLKSDSVEEGFDESAIATYEHVLRSRSLSYRVLQRLKLQPPPQQKWQQSSSLLLRGIQKIGLDIGMSPHVASPESALAQAARTLKARVIPQTRLVEITCESALSYMAAAFANGLVNEFMDEDLESHWNSTQSTNKQLTEELQQLRAKMEESERALNDYAQKSGITFTSSTSSNATLIDEKLRTTQQDLARAENDRVAREVTYKIASTSPEDSIPDAANAQTLQQYKNQLADLKRQLADLSATFTPAYFKIKAIQAQINEVQQAAEKERVSAVAQLKSDYDQAVRREAIFGAAYQRLVESATVEARRVLQYGTLKNDFDANRQLYEGVSRRVKELDITSAVHSSNIRVIDTAEPPEIPDRPNPVRNLGFGVFGGMSLGAAFLFWREYIGTTFWIPGESTSVLALPELGVIPSNTYRPVTPLLTSSPIRMLSPIFDRLGQNGKVQPTEMGLADWQQRTSFTAESFRRTVASLLFSGNRGSETGQRRPLKVMVVTSPGQGDGKTTVCSNLAVGFAEIKLRVLLVDCDLRKPSLHKVFDISNTWGISNILSETTDINALPIEAVCRETKIPGLHILTSGPPVVSVSELLFSGRLTQFMLRCRREFDVILIDSPPVLQVSDARALSRHSDGTVLILRAGHSRLKAAIAATQLLLQDGSPIFGTILNDWNPKGGGTDHVYSYYGSTYASYS